MSALESLPYFIPELALLAGAFLVLMLDFSPSLRKWAFHTALVVLLATALAVRTPSEIYPLFFGFFTLDLWTHFFRYAALGIVALTLLVSFSYRPLSENRYRCEYASLLLLVAFGLILMAASTHFLMIFLAIEFVSLISYILVGFLKQDPRAKEASIKYLLFGSVSSALMLFGMSYLFGLTGSLELSVIGQKLEQGQITGLVWVSFFLIVAGLGFKISMAPFHFWAPDVYEGAPTPITGFLTVGPKALGFAVLLRVLTVLFPGVWDHWKEIVTGLSILTMTIGNVIAIAQTNIKRLLAYSSIAQAGYILMGVAVFSETGITAVLIYLVAYAFTNLGAFTAVIAAANQLQSDEIADYAGLSQRSPFLAAAITIFLLSLAGIPPLAGFIGKYLVFASAIEEGFLTLAVAAAINSTVAAYYYFKIIRYLYLTAPAVKDAIPTTNSLTLGLTLMLAGTLIVGLCPSPLIEFVQNIFI